MIAPNTDDWDNLLFNLKFSKKKSNRDVLCLACWEILTYEQRENHLNKNPTHSKEVLTSMWFGTENKFISIAEKNGKIEEINGIRHYEDPFKRRMRRKRLHTEVEEQKCKSFLDNSE